MAEKDPPSKSKKKPTVAKAGSASKVSKTSGKKTTRTPATKQTKAKITEVELPVIEHSDFESAFSEQIDDQIRNDVKSNRNILNPVSKSGTWLLAAILVGGFVAWMISGQLEKQPEKIIKKNRVEQAAALPEVQVRRFALQSYSPSIILNGETLASRRVILKAESSAVVKSLSLKKGDYIKKDKLLVTLDPGISLAKIDQAKAQVEREQHYAQSINKLIIKGHSSKLEQADANNNLATAKVQLATARQEYSKSKISAPFSGLLVHQYVELGDYVSPGTALFEIADVTPMLVRVYITEKELAKIQDQRLTADVILSTGKYLDADMKYLSPQSEDKSNTFILDFTLNTKGTLVQLGLSARVTVHLAPIEAISISPALLFLDNEGNPALKIINDDNQVGYAPVTIVQAGSDTTWVTGNDLSNKDIIVAGQGFVVEGDRVIPHSGLKIIGNE